MRSNVYEPLSHLRDRGGCTLVGEIQVVKKIRLLFAHCANGSLSFVRLLKKKQTEVIHLQMD